MSDHVGYARESIKGQTIRSPDIGEKWNVTAEDALLRAKSAVRVGKGGVLYECGL